MDLSFEGGTLLIFLAGLIIFVVALVLIMKRMMTQRAASDELSHKYEGKGSPLEARTKYPEADAFRYSGTFFNLGLALAIGLTIMAFSWTLYEDQVIIPEDALELPDEIEVEPSRTAEPPPPPPPPPPPVIEEVPEEEILEEEEVEFVDQSVEVDEIVEAPPQEEAPPPPPPPPPPPEPKVEEIFKVVEEMPRFPAPECENLGTMQEKKACSDKAMLEFIYKNIKYPAIARENGVEGTVVIQFVVEKDGSIAQAKILRDIGAQCGGEALRVVNLMNEKGLSWVPGKQRGRSVRVQFNLPVKFRLE